MSEENVQRLTEYPKNYRIAKKNQHKQNYLFRSLHSIRVNEKALIFDK